MFAPNSPSISQSTLKQMYYKPVVHAREGILTFDELLELGLS
jgi:hypothetical protein